MLIQTPALLRRLLAELVGTALLVTAMVGSGAMVKNLSPDDHGLQLLAISTTVGFAFVALILMFGPVSGAHFNPVVSIADWWLGRKHGTGLTAVELGGYLVAQIVGGILGAILANLEFDLGAVTMSNTERSGVDLLLGEVIAAGGLVVLIFALARSGRAAVAPAAVGAYFAGAFWFTSSTAFANPAVTIGRTFTDTIVGIAPASVAAFVAAQLLGMLFAIALLMVLYPAVGSTADQVVVPAGTAPEKRRGFPSLRRR
jgi:glycerol uptake facilitator-like aquaporin